MAVQFALMLAVLTVGPSTGHVASSPMARTAAVILLVLGACMGIAGVVALGQNRTVFPRPLADGTLVQAGVFRLVRHPLYSSLMHLSFGWAVWWHSGAVAVLAVLLTLLLHCKSLREEQWLQQKFPDYAAYAAKVKRFVPWVV